MCITYRRTTMPVFDFLTMPDWQTHVLFLSLQTIQTFVLSFRSIQQNICTVVTLCTFLQHLRWGCVFIFTPKPERPNHISCSTHKFSVFFSSTPCSTTLKNTNQNSTSHYTKNDKIYSKNLPHQLQIKYFYELNKNLTKIHNHITPVSQQLSL